MASNLNKLIKVSNILDQSGNYVLSDKLDNLIKISQNLFSEMPSMYAPTGPLDVGNKLLNSALSNMGDSAAGSAIFAKGKMFDRFSPYESKHGPEGPAVLPTLTPAQYAKLLETEAGRKFIAQMQLSGAMKATNFMNQSNVGLKSLGRFIEQNTAPGVEKGRAQEFINNILPNTIAQQVATTLQAFPITEWDGRLRELSQTANSSPQYANQIKTMINNAVTSALRQMKSGNQQNYAKMVADPKFQAFSDKFT